MDIQGEMEIGSIMNYFHNLKEIYERRMSECDKKAKSDKIRCMFDFLYDLTKIQDVVNIRIMKAIDNEQDPRWIPIHIIDNANAIILGISRNIGDPKTIVEEGYVEDKLKRLESRFDWIKMIYKK